MALISLIPDCTLVGRFETSPRPPEQAETAPGPVVIEGHPHITKGHTQDVYQGRHTGHSSYWHPLDKLLHGFSDTEWDVAHKTQRHMEGGLQWSLMWNIRCCGYKTDCLFTKNERKKRRF